MMSKKTIVRISLAFLLFIMTFAIFIARADEPLVCAVYFTKTGCYSCDVVDLIVTALVSEYEGRFIVVEYDVSQPINSVAQAEYDVAYNCGRGTPLIVLGVNDYLSGDQAIKNGLKNKIDNYLNSSGNSMLLLLEDGSSWVSFKDLNGQDLRGSPIIRVGSKNPPLEVPTLLAVIAAAAVDSVNPCEFAVLVILLSGVIASGGRKKALKTGLAFVFAVFVMYLLMGLGIFSITLVPGITYYFYKAVGVFALFVGVLNIKDYFWESARGVLSSVPESWRPRVQKLLDEATSVPGALLSGVFVSIFLLPCSSGPYFSAIGLLAYEATKPLAIVLLLLYNLIFILPMIGIVLAVYFGLTTTAKAAHWRHKRLGLLHLIAGVLMFGMGIWMLFFF